MQKEIEEKTKNSVACMASGKNLKYQIPKREFGKLKTLTEPGRRNSNRLFQKIKQQKIKRRTSNLNRGRQIQ